MKIGYVIMALITLLLIVGCKTKVEEAPVAPVVEEVVEEAPVEPEKPSDQYNIDTSGMSEENLAELQRLKDACDRGSAKLCTVLARREAELGVQAADVLPATE
ncbi:hypothetical protein CEE44_00775 [Candidatus Woesearchaeota archaeon B3_Woes]|nr:MAG: hypothetical protein CEE44_00775 [Candidatus Woesearchaeota archaeon B3_Woes]